VPASKAPAHESLPWSVRLYAAAPFPPVVCGLLACTAFGLIYVTYCWIVGIPAGERAADFQLLQVAMIAFTPAVSVHSLRAVERDLAALAPLLDADAAPERVLRGSRQALVLAGLGGVAIALALVLQPSSWTDGEPPLSHPVFWWAALRSVAMGWLIARLVAIELGVGVGFRELGALHTHVDWLDQRPLAPFARQGLRSVLLLLLFPFLFSLFLFEPWGKLVAVSMLVLFPAFCVAALLLPVSGVHRRLEAVKRDELARVDAALRVEAETNLKAPGPTDAAGPQSARLANLVAWRGLVDAASTWPFDLAVWLRFAVYVSLGLGSWLGGALVERLLGVALD
jgi:hypothetical protein